MKKIRFGALLLSFALLFQALPAMAAAGGNADGLDLESLGFRLEEKRRAEDGTASYYFKHLASGAAVYYDSNGEALKEFTIGFRTPPSDNSGANHVLEHSLLCGNRKYPSKNLMYYLSANSVAQMINAFTMDDGTQYSIKTVNETDFYNLADVYINTVFCPNLLTEERIFQQQGIRREYADGRRATTALFTMNCACAGRRWTAAPWTSSQKRCMKASMAPGGRPIPQAERWKVSNSSVMRTYAASIARITSLPTASSI